MHPCTYITITGIDVVDRAARLLSEALRKLAAKACRRCGRSLASHTDLRRRDRVDLDGDSSVHGVIW